MVLNSIHQLPLAVLTIGRVVVVVVVMVLLLRFDGDINECTLVGFEGFWLVMVSLWDIGDILLSSAVHPSALETFFPAALPPKTR